MTISGILTRIMAQQADELRTARGDRSSNRGEISYREDQGSQEARETPTACGVIGICRDHSVTPRARRRRLPNPKPRRWNRTFSCLCESAHPSPRSACPGSHGRSAKHSDGLAPTTTNVRRIRYSVGGSVASSVASIGSSGRQLSGRATRRRFWKMNSGASATPRIVTGRICCVWMRNATATARF